MVKCEICNNIFHIDEEGKACIPRDCPASPDGEHQLVYRAHIQAHRDYELESHIRNLLANSRWTELFQFSGFLDIQKHLIEEQLAIIRRYRTPRS